MTSNNKKQVLFLTRILTHYRVPFHEAVRTRLSEAGVDYRLAYSQPPKAEAKKGDLGTLAWAEPVRGRYFGSANLFWQDIPTAARPDLIIIGQENKILSNYALQVGRWFGGPRLAFFGHGKNFQAENPNSPGERFKRLWIDKVDWWFAYTDRSADVVAESGFSRDRITVFNNAIDTSSIQRDLATVGEDEREKLRAEQFSGSKNIGVYVGGLYDRKRLPFLIEAACAIRSAVPDFHMLVIGGGPDAELVKAAAHEHGWIRHVGPKFGREKTLLVSLGRVFLMPGLVGLGVLDSFAYGTPMVTTQLSYHSPEIDYLQHGANGIVVADSGSAEAYAAEVVRILRDEHYRERLKAGGAEALQLYTTDNMAQRFADGVLEAVRLKT